MVMLRGPYRPREAQDAENRKQAAISGSLAATLAYNQQQQQGPGAALPPVPGAPAQAGPMGGLPPVPGSGAPGAPQTTITNNFGSPGGASGQPSVQPLPPAPGSMPMSVLPQSAGLSGAFGGAAGSAPPPPGAGPPPSAGPSLRPISADSLAPQLPSAPQPVQMHARGGMQMPAPSQQQPQAGPPAPQLLPGVMSATEMLQIAIPALRHAQHMQRMAMGGPMGMDGMGADMSEGPSPDGTAGLLDRLPGDTSVSPDMSNRLANDDSVPDDAGTQYPPPPPLFAQWLDRTDPSQAQGVARDILMSAQQGTDPGELWDIVQEMMRAKMPVDGLPPALMAKAGGGAESMKSPPPLGL